MKKRHTKEKIGDLLSKKIWIKASVSRSWELVKGGEHWETVTGAGMPFLKKEDGNWVKTASQGGVARSPTAIKFGIQGRK